MSLQQFLHDMNLNAVDKKYILVLLLFSVILTAFMIRFNNIRGAFYSDIFVYLGAALDFAQLDHSNIFNQNIMFNSPVICLLTSILFRLGFVNINSLFIVTGIFGIIGIIGMYVLLRFRFSRLLSFTGAVLYSSFTVNLYYFANGLVDIPAVALIIWMVIFTVMAVDRNPKYYPLVVLVFLLGFFTRYTNGVAIFLIPLYMMKNHTNLTNFFRTPQFKWIALSIAFFLMIFALVVAMLKLYGSNIRFLYMVKVALTNPFSTKDTAYLVDKFFYVKNYLNFLFSNTITYNNVRIESYIGISPIAIFVALLTCYGFILKLYNIFRQRHLYTTSFTDSQKKSFRNLLVILTIIAIAGLFISYVISVIALWLILALLIRNSDKLPTNRDNFAFSCICIGLFLFYLIIFSNLNIKCARYIIPTLPAFVYFVIYAIEQISTLISSGWDDEYDFNFNLKNRYRSQRYASDMRHTLSLSIPIILIVLCLFYALCFPNTCPVNEDALDIEEISQVVILNDPDYKDKKIGTFNGTRFFKWYFQMNVKKLYIEKPVSSKYDYVISAFEWEDSRYHKVYTAGQYNLYAKY